MSECARPNQALMIYDKVTRGLHCQPELLRVGDDLECLEQGSGGTIFLLF
jgi:hypothetical protein